MLKLSPKKQLLTTTCCWLSFMKGKSVFYLQMSLQKKMDTELPSCLSSEIPQDISFTPIGYLRSCFKTKNGTPRQPTVCSYARAKLTIRKSLYNQPEHSLEGLEQFSHVWVIFIFHQNASFKFSKAKVKPPRLNGAKVGVFACRSPYRPNPVGLTLAKIEQIKGDTLHLSGVDMVDGTPVLDLKPFIPSYDSLSADTQLRKVKDQYSGRELKYVRTRPQDTIPTYVKSDSAIPNLDTSCRAEGCDNVTQKVINGERTILVDDLVEENQGSTIDCYPNPHIQSCEGKTDCSPSTCVTSKDVNIKDGKRISGEANSNGMMGPNTSQEEITSQDVLAGVSVPDWVYSPPIDKLTVRFTPHAEKELENLFIDNNCTLEFLRSHEEARQAICDILLEDPRSTYRRNRCQDQLYFFPIDTIHVTCWFGDNFAEVLRIQPIDKANIPNLKGID